MITITETHIILSMHRNHHLLPCCFVIENAIYAMCKIYFMQYELHVQELARFSSSLVVQYFIKHLNDTDVCMDIFTINTKKYVCTGDLF